MYFSPPDHPKCPGFGLGVYRIFFPKCPFFGVASLGNETPVLVSETRERPGISRVKDSDMAKTVCCVISKVLCVCINLEYGTSDHSSISTNFEHTSSKCFTCLSPMFSINSCSWCLYLPFWHRIKASYVQFLLSATLFYIYVFCLSSLWVV